MNARYVCMDFILFFVRNMYEFQELELTAKAYQCRVKAIDACTWKVLLHPLKSKENGKA